MFAILRTEKLKSKIEVRSAIFHCFRAQKTENADIKKINDNIYIFSNTKESALTKFNSLLPSRVRKNAVYCIEYLISASPEYFQNITINERNKYFNDSLSFLKKKHGVENCIHASLHLDETTPHLHVFVIPIDKNNKLNCREYLGGSSKLRKLQSDFVKAAGEPNGLCRGIEGSKAKHTKVSQFYSKLNNANSLSKQLKLPSATEYAQSAFIKSESVKNLEEAASLLQYQNVHLEILRNNKIDLIRAQTEINDLKRALANTNNLYSQSTSELDTLNGVATENALLKDQNNWFAHQQSLLNLRLKQASKNNHQTSDKEVIKNEVTQPNLNNQCS